MSRQSTISLIKNLTSSNPSVWQTHFLFLLIPAINGNYDLSPVLIGIIITVLFLLIFIIIKLYVASLMKKYRKTNNDLKISQQTNNLLIISSNNKDDMVKVSYYLYYTFCIIPCSFRPRTPCQPSMPASWCLVWMNTQRTSGWYQVWVVSSYVHMYVIEAEVNVKSN